MDKVMGLDDVFTDTRYKGYTVEDVIAIDKGYIMKVLIANETHEFDEEVLEILEQK